VRLIEQLIVKKPLPGLSRIASNAFSLRIAQGLRILALLTVNIVFTSLQAVNRP